MYMHYVYEIWKDQNLQQFWSQAFWIRDIQPIVAQKKQHSKIIAFLFPVAINAPSLGKQMATIQD